MKYITKYLSLGLLLSTAGILGSCCPTTPTIGGCAPIRTTWVPITVGQNLYTQYHKLLFPEGYEEYDDCNACSWASDFSVTYRYIQSRNGAQIANALWGTNQLVFQGNDIQGRNNNALVAEYFGMGPDTDGAISLCPRLRNQVIDFQLAISGAKFWAQINLPATYAKWSVNSNCGAPAFQGTYGKSNLDGATVELNYAQDGTVTIAGTTMVPTNNTLLFDGTSLPNPATATQSFIAALNAAHLINVDTAHASISNQIILFEHVVGTGVQNSIINVGAVKMGLYGQFDAITVPGNVGMNNVSSFSTPENVGFPTATFSTAEVLAAPDAATALGGYTFGMVQQRNNNLFNFSPCGAWRLADIPIMVGYDFCKSDATHLGVYLKFVIPTGTRVDQCLLKYVLTPVIGNGHHFEFGIGLTGHANIWVCDTSSFGVYGDGYIDYMFGACQTRTFDLQGQPMSRYALAYPLTGDLTNRYSVGNTMSAIGDINLYQGNVTATRGEFMFDFIWACRSWEVGLGYAFTGQSGERINCGPCKPLSSKKSYALVGNALQQSFGVGPLSSLSNDTATFGTLPYDPKTPGAPTYPQSNFIYLGSTNEAAEMSDGESAAYSYGTPTSLDSAAFPLPDVQGNYSGLMSGQVLNRIFGHIDYVWRDCAWQPEIGIVGSIGFVPAGKPTANYWDLGARIGFAF